MRFQQELLQHRASITARYGHRITSWAELYKREPLIVHDHREELERLRLSLLGSNMIMATPQDLGPIASGRQYHQELVHLIGRYGLDTNDALILMEADRLGVRAIITMDRDMERALPNFGPYLWR